MLFIIKHFIYHIKNYSYKKADKDLKAFTRAAYIE
jgi:hypothetical protein